MNMRKVCVMSFITALGVSCPMVMAAKDYTNTYSTAGASNTVVLEGAKRVDSTGTLLIERTSTSPVLIERTHRMPVVIEDRIVKKKHAFKLGLWPLFDFEVR